MTTTSSLPIAGHLSQIIVCKMFISIDIPVGTHAALLSSSEAYLAQTTSEHTSFGDDYEALAVRDLCGRRSCFWRSQSRRSP
jgi:hypothetical protein